MTAPAYTSALVGALGKEGVHVVDEFTRAMVEDLAGVLEALVDELADKSGEPRSEVERQLGAAVAAVLVGARVRPSSSPAFGPTGGGR